MNGTSERRTRKLLFPALGLGLALLAGACVDVVSNRPILVTQPAVSTQPRVVAPLPDVSVRRCVDDGFDLIAVYNASGVPERYLCVDRQSGRKCESWAYYRGECVLGMEWSTTSGSAAAPREAVSGQVPNCAATGQAGESKLHGQSATGSGCPSGMSSHGASTSSPRLESGNAGE